VVTTPAIFDIARIVEDEGVGTVLHDMAQYEMLRIELAEAIERSQAPDRTEKSVRAAKKWLDWSAHLPKIKETYMELQ
jgi:UDP:flavonoid glycosyltransferase YjiC (YdhE family)